MISRAQRGLATELGLRVPNAASSGRSGGATGRCRCPWRGSRRPRGSISPVIPADRSENKNAMARPTASDPTCPTRAGRGATRHRRSARTPGCPCPPSSSTGRPRRCSPGCPWDEVPGEVTGHGFEPRLRDPHPVVDRPREPPVEIEADDRAAVLLHQRQQSHRDRLQRVGARLDRGRNALPRGVEEVPAEGVLRRERDRVQESVDRSPPRLELGAERFDLRRDRSRPSRGRRADRATAWRTFSVRLIPRPKPVSTISAPSS